MKTSHHKWMRWIIAAGVVVLLWGTVRNPSFWLTPEQQGDALAKAGSYSKAARAYRDPRHIGWAQYRAGDFADAAQTFARLPGAIGAFNQGNALLMHGKYDDAIASYDRAIGFEPNWQDAIDNRALAVVRRDKIAAAAKNEGLEGTDEKPDEIVFDAKGENKGKPIELSGSEPLDDAALQATWLRRVQTTPADFLRAKFSFQAQQATTPEESP